MPAIGWQVSAYALWGILVQIHSYSTNPSIKYLGLSECHAPLVEVSPAEGPALKFRLESYETFVHEREEKLERIFVLSFINDNGNCEEWEEGRLVENKDGLWELEKLSESLEWEPQGMTLGSTEICDSLLAIGLGEASTKDMPFGKDPRLDPAGPLDLTGRRAAVEAAAPHWPPNLLEKLAARGLGTVGDGLGCGGAVVFCPLRFVELVALSDAPGPLLFPHGTYKLGLDLGAGTAELRAALRQGRGSVLTTLANCGVDSLTAEALGGGRLVAELPLGGSAQLGDDLAGGVEMMTPGLVEVEFQGGQPLGMSFCPVLPGDLGAEVMEVEEGGQADRLGVREGWVFREIKGRDVGRMPFRELDALFDLPAPWPVAFSTACAADRPYAVELPAARALPALRRGRRAAAAHDRLWAARGRLLDAKESKREALALKLEVDLETGEVAAAEEEREADARGLPCDPGRALARRCGGPGAAVLWREPFARLFLGDPGSGTPLHVDLVPQLEVSHAAAGAKLVGVARRGAATRALLEAHVDGREPLCETKVPSHRPPDAAEAALLAHPAVTLALVLPGDVLAFNSGQAHFAANGAGTGPSAAVYHGLVTAATAPALLWGDPRATAGDGEEGGGQGAGGGGGRRWAGGGGEEEEEEEVLRYGRHLAGADLLRGGLATPAAALAALRANLAAAAAAGGSEEEEEDGGGGKDAGKRGGGGAGARGWVVPRTERGAARALREFGEVLEAMAAAGQP